MYEIQIIRLFEEFRNLSHRDVSKRLKITEFDGLTQLTKLFKNQILEICIAEGSPIYKLRPSYKMRPYYVSLISSEA